MNNLLLIDKEDLHPEVSQEEIIRNLTPEEIAYFSEELKERY